MSTIATSQAALITGASSGIGRDLATLFAQDRNNLVLVARRIEKLEELGRSLEQRHGIQVTCIRADLAHPQAPSEIIARLELEHIVIHSLVNNAGYGRLGPFVDNDPLDDLQMIQVNVAAVTALTKLIVGGMIARRQGRILNIASTAAFQPGPLMAVYYASKAYVLSFSEALANELEGSGVTVTVLCPGPTRTGFQVVAGLDGPGALPTPKMDSATVARIGYRAMLKGRRLIVPGISNKLLTQGTRLVPRKLSAAIVRWVQESRQ